MRHYRHYTQQEVIDALIKAKGLQCTAAEALHCDRATISRFINRYPAVKAAHEQAIQATVDLAQSKLLTLVEREDWRAIRFLLVTLGKDRGFTERQEIVAVGDDREALRRQFLDDIRRVYGDEDDDEDEEE